jgi:putative heme iron utilization protein
MGWVAAPDYSNARPDPLADAAASIIQHMNADHTDALILMARTFAEIEASEAVMTSVDRLGFHVRLKSGEEARGARIAFLRPAESAVEVRTVLVEMTGLARKAKNPNRES